MAKFKEISEMKQKCFLRICIRRKDNWKMKLYVKLANLDIRKLTEEQKKV